uniref:Uncharacterized protein n=1 Tax=Anguilla anguilla TaxID=7936 RepID=A0A0E9SYV5_ANGAN
MCEVFFFFLSKFSVFFFLYLRLSLFCFFFVFLKANVKMKQLSHQNTIFVLQKAHREP